MHTTWLDESKNTETRWHAVGIIKGGVNCIIAYNSSHDNGEEIIRIISARKISKIEMKNFGICPDQQTSQVLGHSTSESFKGWFRKRVQ